MNRRNPTLRFLNQRFLGRHGRMDVKSFMSDPVSSDI